MNNIDLEMRRIDLLQRLSSECHPLSIFDELEQSQLAVFIISDTAALSIRRGLADLKRRVNESSALARVKIAAQTPDKSHFVYLIEHFQFENLGTADGVVSVERDRLNVGEIEVHSHVYLRPDYLGQVDVGDLMAVIEGPAWLHPQVEHRNTATRIFGILSVYANGLATLQFYIHDLRDFLEDWNNYGLKRLGMPISLLDAYTKF